MDTDLEKINALIPIQQGVAGFNPALTQLYPIAIAVGDEFRIYDLDVKLGVYRFVKTTPTPMPIPAGVRAAFQLADYGGRIACVVTPEVFDTPAGCVTLLHEFVHCYQYETCEQDLKGKLDIARLALEKGDFMWEIEHPFPYQAGSFIRAYQAFLEAVAREDAQQVQKAREALRTYLGLHDFEYMVWQEWKEGFARWVENRLQHILGLKENKAGLDSPFSRVTFYAGGAAYIDWLHEKTPSLVHDLRQLFDQISRPMRFK
jgi:hypothetical protein